ncbi:hypothetical protein [Streptomyces sp. NBC_01455]|uniref:hypothetical protein n=1 Tax=Streptomyces sp. NBC_01455 TaxID=2903874 RepID=UPI002E370D14|nr:hypothetical protein [Streptomyces sp. NBC_01455]
MPIASSTLSNWLNGQTAPLKANLSTYWDLILYLEKHAEGPHRRREEWKCLISQAMAERDRKHGGRPSNAPRPTRAAPFRFRHNAAMHLPQVLAGREAELDGLQGLIRSGSPYLALIAPAWAGKSAFLAAFATNHAPEDIDLVAYFIRRGHEPDPAQKFLSTMVTALSKHAGRKSGQADRTTLLALYEAAAQKSLDRRRNLLLLVDGLDEDTGAGIDGISIASLLPPQPCPGLRVLVSRRWHPPLPGDVPMHHPLHTAEQVPGFRPSPHAAVLRSTALNDLDALLHEQGWKREILGFLTLATGGLSHNDLVKLTDTGEHASSPIPHDVGRLLHSVVGRVAGPEDLEPDTFVLAHADLYDAATRGLGSRVLTELAQRLDAWADQYRADGWPESTPGYLLHHYPELMRSTGNHDRWTSFALDHRRLLRLADRGRSDVATASLDRLTQTATDARVLASVAASRSLLAGDSTVVPREVLRALGVVGDAARARSLALSPADPASKAVRLIDVVQALTAAGTRTAADHAAALAREATVWAEKAQQQDLTALPTEELDTAALLPRAAVALAATGQPDLATRLLASADICSPENVAAVAEAAALLLESHPSFAGRLLDELTAEADYQAQSPEGRPAFAREIWTAVAGADPRRTESTRDRAEEAAQRLEREPPDPLAVAPCSLTAPEAPEDVQRGTRNPARARRRPAADAAGTAPQSEESESRSQELLVAGETPDRAHALVAEARETEELLHRMSRLSDLGDGPQLRQAIEQFLQNAAGQNATAEWLHLLAHALACAPGGVEADQFTSVEAALPDTALRVKVLTSAALAHAGAGRPSEALTYATGAAEAIRRMKAPTRHEPLLVAQAFAHAGQTEEAEQWARPAHGRRPTGKAGIPYRRAALAVQIGLDPQTAVARMLSDDLPPPGLSPSATGHLRILRTRAAGARTEAQLASLETTARARLETEPLLATTLALLHAALGDTDRACHTAAQLPDPAARGLAQATLASYLTGIPAFPDVTANESHWTLSLLKVLIHHTHPPQPGHDTTVHDLVLQALTTSSWHQALPVLSRTTPTALTTITSTLNQHREP